MGGYILGTKKQRQARRDPPAPHGSFTRLALTVGVLLALWQYYPTDRYFDAFGDLLVELSGYPPGFSKDPGAWAEKLIPPPMLTGLPSGPMGAVERPATSAPERPTPAPLAEPSAPDAPAGPAGVSPIPPEPESDESPNRILLSVEVVQEAADKVGVDAALLYTAYAHHNGRRYFGGSVELARNDREPQPPERLVELTAFAADMKRAIASLSEPTRSIKRPSTPDEVRRLLQGSIADPQLLRLLKETSNTILDAAVEDYFYEALPRFR